MFYWTIGNIEPKYRSYLNAIHLYAIAKTEKVKEYGIESVLKRFLNDIYILETVGLTVPTLDGKRVY